VLSWDEARLQLSRLHAGGGQRLRDVWLALAQLTIRALNVERVGVWVFTDGGRAIRCRYLLQRSSNQVFQGAVLRVSDFPSYFKALDNMRLVCAADAQTSEATRELLPAYLAPLGITSMLDAPIYLNGQLVGVVCHEHVGPTRTWTEPECDFAAAVADNIARLYREHERHDAQATLQGYERRLMELQRMEAVGRMALGVAHDFRGILGLALGFTELIVPAPDDAERVKHYAERIREALVRGQHLTREVMDFGKEEIQAPRLLNLVDALQESTRMLQSVVGPKIAVELQICGSLGRILMDSSQLERALLNLVLNARDAMPEGGKIVISARDVDARGERGEESTCVEIAIRDTGIGMTEDILKNVFTPFFTTKGEQGNGLGLVIVRQIVSRAGGFVRVDSKAGQGTTVHIYVPRLAAA
jgi:two-component system cell cycle sensor histidine kinase/response regulator CckA